MRRYPGEVNLPDPYMARVVALREQGLTFAVIAKRLGIDRSTVSRLFSKAKGK